MAIVFYKQGQIEEAIEWSQRALAGYEKALGVNHPYTQDTLRGLVNFYQSAGQTEQAQTIQARLNASKTPAI